MKIRNRILKIYYELQLFIAKKQTNHWYKLFQKSDFLRFPLSTGKLQNFIQKSYHSKEYYYYYEQACNKIIFYKNKLQDLEG